MGLIYTSRVGYKGPGALDITVKSASDAGRILAPTWALVGGHKHWAGYAPLTDDQYTALYLDILRGRYRENEQAFIELICRAETVLLCYCPAGVFCHRHLAVKVLKKIATAKGLTLFCGGELSSHQNT